MHCHLFSIKHPQIKIEKNQSPTEEHEKSFSPLWNWNSRVKNPRKIQGSKLDTITCRRKAGTQRSPFHPIDNPDGTRRVQASLAGRSHFNRGAEVLTWKVQVCAVQVCVRGWPTCRGRAAHYSNPCVAVCARCPPPPPPPISFRRGKYNVHICSAGSFHFRRVSARYPRENVLEHVCRIAKRRRALCHFPLFLTDSCEITIRFFDFSGCISHKCRLNLWSISKFLSRGYCISRFSIRNWSINSCVTFLLIFCVFFFFFLVLN